MADSAQSQESGAHDANGYTLPPAFADRAEALLPEHRAYLNASGAISDAVIDSAGIYSAVNVADLPEHARGWGKDATPAIVFPWKLVDGRVVEQVRPEIAVMWDGEQHKYLWPKGAGAVLNAPRHLPEASTVLIVEGTKQSFAAASWAPEGVAVYGIGGCRNWTSDGIPISALTLAEGKKVAVCLDADAASNLDVYTAGIKLGETVRAEGATDVAFVRLPASGNKGLDDVLASRPEEGRTTYLTRLIEQAKPKPADRAPAAKKRKKPVTNEVDPDDFFDNTGILVAKCSAAVRAGMPALLTQENTVALYRDGYFHADPTAFRGALARLLGDRYRPTSRSAVEEYTVGVLYDEKKVLPEYTADALLNVRNGMLDLATGTLKPHDPVYRSSQQIPIEWDPDATCPTYEAWLTASISPEQLEDLEESVAQMLDPSRTPHKAVFLFGPSRSGKSTFLRLMQRMVGGTNYSAVTLHQLAQNRFAAANVYGKMLNCAADLSSTHVDDLSIFKMMTGEDPIQADRKHGQQFPFINTALFAFSANELPTVGESSRAYTERIKPFEFPNSFAGHEAPSIEARMIEHELPGILARWVKAWQRMHGRGGVYQTTSARVAKEFETRSDRVRQWVEERCLIHTVTDEGAPIAHGTTVKFELATTKVDLVNAFNAWADQNNGSKMGQRKVIDRLLTVPGVVEVRRNPTKVRCLNVTLRDEKDQAWDDDDAPESGAEAGGSFEGPVAVSGPPVAVSDAETATATPQVTAMSQPPVAEVAVSNPTTSTFGFSRPTCATQSNNGAKRTGEEGVFSILPVVGVETATSATAATDPTPRVTGQDPLRGRTPTWASVTPGDYADPVADLFASVGATPPTCERCGGPQEVSDGAWFACPHCHPDSIRPL